MAQNMHFDITGDCSSAIAALSNTESAVTRLAGMDAAVGVQVRGAPSAISQLESVGAAAQAASGNLAITADARGITSTISALSDLQSTVQGVGRDLDGLGGGLGAGIAGGWIDPLTGGLIGMGRAARDSGSALDDFTASGGRASDVGGGMETSLGRATRAITEHHAEVQGLTDGYRDLVGASAGVVDVQNAFGSGRMAQALRGAMPGGLSNWGQQQWLGNAPAGPPPPGWSGPGGTGGGGGGAGGGGGRLGGDSTRGVGMYGLMAGAVGILESAAAGAGGFLAVNAAIKDNPVLAREAKAAMNELKSGIAETSWAALGEGVPGLERLGSALHGLGQEVGSIGAEHMGTALTGATDLAGRATSALKALDPAIDSSMKGLTSVGGAIIDGLGNGSVASAIKTTSDAMQQAGAGGGIQALTTGAATDASTVGTALTDAINTGGQLLKQIGDTTKSATGSDLSGAIGGGGLIGAVTKNPVLGGLATLDLAQAQIERDHGRGDLSSSGVFGTAGGYGLAKAFGLGGLPAALVAGAGDLLTTGAEYAIDSGHGGAFGAPGSGQWWKDQLPQLPWSNNWGFSPPTGGRGGGAAPGLFSGGDWSDKTPKAPDPKKPTLEDSFLAYVGGGGDPASFGSANQGGGAYIVGQQGAGTWTAGPGWGGYGGGAGSSVPASPTPIGTTGDPGMGGGAGGGGGGPVVIPKGGQGLGVISGATAAALGLGSGGASNVGPGAGTPTGSSALGGGDPRPTGGLSTDGRVTLSSGWGPGGKFSTGGAPQILSSLTDLRSTASNMFGAMGGLPGGGADAAALRRDWAATRDTVGSTNSDQYADASRFLGSDIQRASQSTWDGGQAAVDAYTERLYDQHPDLQRAPATGVSSAAVGGQSLPGGPPIYSGLGDAPMSNFGRQLSSLGGRPGAPGEVSSPRTSLSPAATLASREPGGVFKGPLGAGSAGPAGAAQLERMNQVLQQSRTQLTQTNQTSNQLGQSLQQLGQSSTQAATGTRQEAVNTQGLASGASSASNAMGGLNDSLKGAQGAAGGASSAMGGLGAAQGGFGDTGLSGFAGLVGTGASQAASISGQAIAQSMAQGIQSGSGAVGAAAGAMGQSATNAAATALKTHSPSQEFVAIGESTGQGAVIGINSSMPAVGGAVSAGLVGVLDAARGVASDAGLQVGFTFVESMNTGAEQAVKTSDFMKLDSPEIKGAAAKAALGLGGFLGAAGSGAQSYQLSAREVGFGAGTPAVAPTQQITVQSILDGQVLDQRTVTIVNAALNQLASSLTQQRNG